FGWRRRGRTITVRIHWRGAFDLYRALDEVLGSVLRQRPWDQASGTVYALDRSAWLDGTATWPQGRLVGQAPPALTDQAGRPVGASLSANGPGIDEPALVTAVANPHGRNLVGAAARYRLTQHGYGLTVHDGAGRTLARLDPTAGPQAAILNPALSR